MSRKLSAADVWRSAGRQRRFQLGVPQLMPSGVRLKLCRPEFEVWYGSNRLPQALANDVALVFGKDKAEDMSMALKEMGEERASGVLEFLHRVTKESVMGIYLPDPDNPGEEKVTPIRVVDEYTEDSDEEEMLLSDISNEDQGTILAKVLESLPDQPVRTKGGSVSLESLSTFRPEHGGSGAGSGSGEVQPAAQ